MKNSILTKLPINKNNIKREDMVGMFLDVVYKGIKYNVFVKKIILDTNGIKKFIIEHDGYVNENGVYCEAFCNGSFGGVLNPNYVHRGLSIGDVVTNNFCKLKVLDLYRGKDNRVRAKYSCVRCGYIGDKDINNMLVKKKGCPCCSNQVVVQGINDMYTTDHWMVELGVDEEFAKTHTSRSNKKAPCRCPHCGEEFISKNKCSDIYKQRSIGCKRCSDRLTIPEKFMYNFLLYLKIDFVYQLTKSDFDWCEKYRYDFYIPSLNMIIETHGGQHYVDTTWNTLESTKENDYKKSLLARCNGVGNYIVVDCRESDYDYLINSILNSDLSKYFDMDNINWGDIVECASSNLMKEVCDYWECYCDNITVPILANHFNISNYTTRNFVKRGSDLGWCVYNAYKEQCKSANMRKISNCKMVEVYKNDILVGTFNSVIETSKAMKNMFQLNITKNYISRFCRGYISTYSKYAEFKFKYINKE